VVVQIHVPVLDAAPKPLDEDVVQRPTTAVHTDLNALCLQAVCSSMLVNWQLWSELKISGLP